MPFVEILLNRSKLSKLKDNCNLNDLHPIISLWKHLKSWTIWRRKKKTGKTLKNFKFQIGFHNIFKNNTNKDILLLACKSDSSRIIGLDKLKLKQSPFFTSVLGFGSMVKWIEWHRLWECNKPAEEQLQKRDYCWYWSTYSYSYYKRGQSDQWVSSRLKT